MWQCYILKAGKGSTLWCPPQQLPNCSFLCCFTRHPPQTLGRMKCRCNINLPNWLILELTGSAQLPAHRNGCSLYIALYNCFFLSVRKTNSYSNLALTVRLGTPVRQPKDLFYSSRPQFLQKAGIAWNHVISHPVGDTAVVIAVGPVRLK